MKRRILLVGGGTGGHLFPAEALLESFLANDYDAKLITDNRCKNYISYPSYSKIIDVKRFSGNYLSRIIGLLNLPISILQSMFFMWKYKPNILISFGGYTSIPHLISAIILRIPIIIHESNSVIGKVNLIFCKNARLILLSYKNTINLPKQYLDKSLVTGNFVRMKLLISSGKIQEKKDEQKFTIFIFGGSQGAKIFSEEITNSIINLSKSYKNIKIIQQVVENDLANIREIYQNNEIEAEIKPFFKDMVEQYREADLVIARSGSSTIAEIIALMKPSILIPLPHSADNHQYFNAKLLEDKSACILIEQKNIKNNLTNLLKEIISEKPKLKLEIMENSLKKLQINGTQILFNSIDKLFH